MGAGRRRKKNNPLGVLGNELGAELSRFVRAMGRGPKIEGPIELQEALDRLCLRIKHNARQKMADGRNEPMRNVGARLKEWYPDEVIVSQQKEKRQ